MAATIHAEEDLAMGLHRRTQLGFSKHSRIPLILHRRNGNWGQNLGNFVLSAVLAPQTWHTQKWYARGDICAILLPASVTGRR